ncbi:MAG: twin-arginine translocation signal domain-containing protein, partial [Actinomycetota bacterium]
MNKPAKRPTLTRRQFLIGAGLGAGALAVGGGALLAERQSPSPPTSRPGGVAKYTLEAAPVDLEIGGRGVATWGYGKDLPGPEIRIKEG